MLEGRALLHYSLCSFGLFMGKVESSVISWKIIYCCLGLEWFWKLNFCECFVFEIVIQWRVLIYSVVDVHFVEMIDIFILLQIHSFRISLGKNLWFSIILLIRGFYLRIDSFSHNFPIIWTNFSAFLAFLNKILIIIEHFLNIGILRSKLSEFNVLWTSIKWRLTSALITAALCTRTIVPQLVHSPQHYHILTDIAQNRPHRLQFPFIVLLIFIPIELPQFLL